MTVQSTDVGSRAGSRRSPRIAMTAIGAVGAVLIAVISLAFSSNMPGAAGAPPMPPTPTAQFFPRGWGDDLLPPDVLVTQLNAALAGKDRTSFFSHVDGSAVQPLTTWWDNMDKLGWTTGVITLGDPTGDWSSKPDSAPDEGEATWTAETWVYLGASFHFASFSPRGSGTEDAGKVLVQAVPYQVTLTFTTDDASDPNASVASITEWGGVGDRTFPWDEAQLYVTQGEHVTLASAESERGLADELLPAAEAAAEKVLQDVNASGSPVPLDGFTAFVTEDDVRFSSWASAPDDWKMDVAGMSIPTYRPPSAADAGISTIIATGMETSTAYVVVGPLALTPDGYEERVFTHEFVHVVHDTAVPISWSDPPRATMEGWARYQESRLANGGTYAPQGSDDAASISECVPYLSPGAPSSGDDAASFYGEDSSCNYWLASTQYAYIVDKGLDGYGIANAAKATGLSALAFSSDEDPSVTEEGWIDWVKSHY